MKSTLSTIETLIVMESPEASPSGPKIAKMPAPKSPAAEMDEAEEDELAKFLATERAALTLQDETLKELWSRANADSAEEG